MRARGEFFENTEPDVICKPTTQTFYTSYPTFLEVRTGAASVSTGDCAVFINKPETWETYIWKNMLDKRRSRWSEIEGFHGT
jgi:hypothetical protein